MTKRVVVVVVDEQYAWELLDNFIEDPRADRAVMVNEGHPGLENILL